MSAMSRTVGVYGEAYIQFELARMGWVVDAIGATANGIDLTAWKLGEPGRGINVKARKRESRTAVTLYKDVAHMEAMRGECKLRGVEPYVAVVVFTDAGNRGTRASTSTGPPRTNKGTKATLT